MKKLLTFDQSYADEHNVPALACFTEEQFEEWCNQSIGEINADYETQMIDYNQKLEDYNNYGKDLIEKGLNAKAYNQYTDEDILWMKENSKPYPHDRPKKADSYLRAWLGNGGEYFGEDYDNYCFGRDLITAGIVNVFDVSEEFYNTFHHANLGDLSLCNVFDEMDYE